MDVARVVAHGCPRGDRPGAFAVFAVFSCRCGIVRGTAEQPEARPGDEAGSPVQAALEGRRFDRRQTDIHQLPDLVSPVRQLPVIVHGSVLDPVVPVVAGRGGRGGSVAGAVAAALLIVCSCRRRLLLLPVKKVPILLVAGLPAFWPDHELSPQPEALQPRPVPLEGLGPVEAPEVHHVHRSPGFVFVSVSLFLLQLGFRSFS